MKKHHIEYVEVVGVDGGSCYLLQNNGVPYSKCFEAAWKI